MNVLMLTNTYLPHVGGVARSVSSLAEGLTRLGHSVLIIAPEIAKGRAHDGAPVGPSVVRIPALQNVAGSPFSMPLLMSRAAADTIDAFRPDIVHTHHPFLLGDKALRVSAKHAVPIVFTYHTRYDLYGDYIAPPSERVRRAILRLAIGYCNLCHHVIAPSASTATHLMNCGVKRPVAVVPTGIDVDRFNRGSRARGRARWTIGNDRFVVGHVGRLAPEKNLEYLTKALCLFLQAEQDAVALIVGDGPLRPAMAASFNAANVEDRVHFAGILEGRDLADAYASQDVFTFASHSETQGLVVIEAMAAGVPIIALDTPGVKDAVHDGFNGSLVHSTAEPQAFTARLSEHRRRQETIRLGLSCAAQTTSTLFSEDRTVRHMEALYADVRRASSPVTQHTSTWLTARRRFARDMDIVANMFDALTHAV